MQHGFMDSSFTWIANEKSQNFAYLFADLDYEVWLTNNRGNKYWYDTIII